MCFLGYVKLASALLLTIIDRSRPLINRYLGVCVREILYGFLIDSKLNPIIETDGFRNVSNVELSTELSKFEFHCKLIKFHSLKCVPKALTPLTYKYHNDGIRISSFY